MDDDDDGALLMQSSALVEIISIFKFLSSFRAAAVLLEYSRLSYVRL